MDCSIPGCPVLYYLLEFAQIHVHESVMLYDRLLLCHPLLLLPSVFPSIRIFQWIHSCIRWPQYWSFSFRYKYSGLISFRIDWFDLLAAQGALQSFFQNYSSKASVLQCPVFMVQRSHLYMTAGKTTALTRWTFVGKAMSLLFNMLFRLVITFLPRRTCLSGSWPQLPLAVFLEPKKIKPYTASVFPLLFAMKWWDRMPWSQFFECWVSSQLFTLLFQPHQKLFSSSLFSAIRVVSYAYLRLLIFLSVVLISACDFIQPSILHNVLCIEVKWTEWQYITLSYFSPNFEPVCCSMSGSNCCFLTDIQISQETGMVVWYSHLFKCFYSSFWSTQSKAFE